MTVGGFGANSGEIKDQKLIPEKLMAYRMFRFRPHPTNATLSMSWGHYVENPLSDDWRPCLTAAAFPEVAYDQPILHTATCQRDQSQQMYYHRVHQMLQTQNVYAGVDEYGVPLRHAAPGPTCACGFWAYYTPEVIDTGNGNEWMALAAVKVQGNVVLGEKGVRAEKMEIAALQPPAELMNSPKLVWDAWNKLTQKLKVPYFWSKAELVEFFPPQDVSELIPKPDPAPDFPYDYRNGSYYRLLLARQRAALEAQQQLQQHRQHGQWTINAPQPMYYTNTSNQFTVTPPEPAPTESPFSKAVRSINDETHYQNVCCVCSYTLVALTQEAADKALAVHILEQHP